MSRSRSDPRKARARRERIRRQKHVAVPKSSEPVDDPADGHDPPESDHFAAERVTGLISRLTRGREFTSDDEFNAFMNENVRGRKFDELKAGFAEDPQWLAQELAYDAMNQSSSETAEQLARQALALDPGCIDALCVLADRLPTAEQREAELRRIISTAEEAFGADFMRENKGRFWGIYETRPYLRARLDLALTVIPSGEAEDALRELAAILELNPDDNQGVRELLVPIALVADLPLAGQVLNEMFPDDDSALMSWSRVLYWTLTSDIELAIEALREARDYNPYVEKYFTGRKKPPQHLPDYYAWGEESEAAHAAFHLAHVFTALREPLRLLASVPNDFDLDRPDPPARKNPTRIQ